MKNQVSKLKTPFINGSLFRNLMITFLFLGLSPIYAQQSWSLENCINYAAQNSFTVKQKLIEIQSKTIQYDNTKMSIAPSISASVGQNLDFGRSQVASSLIISGNQTSTSFGVGLNMSLFEGFRTYHRLKSNQLDIQTTLYELEQARENVEINVMAFYLQILLNKEILEVAKVQEKISIEMVKKTEILVQNGKSSDAELYIAKSTLANDRYAVVEAENNLKLSKIDLAQLMNYPDVYSFDIQYDVKDQLISEVLNKSLDVNAIINNSMQNRPALKAAFSRIEQAKREIKIAQSTWYPSLSLFANYGTGYNYMFTPNPLYPNVPFNDQFSSNSRQVVGVSLSIPIFDRLSTHYNVKLAKLNVQSQELQLDENKRNLTKEIQQAYTAAISSKERYLSALEAYESSKIAFDYEQIRYDAGSSTQYEFDDAKNKYLKAESQVIQAKFDFLFRMKILEFYSK